MAAGGYGALATHRPFAGRDRHSRADRTKACPVMMKNLARAILGLVLTAAATWLANRIVDQVFGPDEPELRA